MIHQARYWVFDMDGTLTLPIHDFTAIRRALHIPMQDDILDHLAALPAEEAAAKRAWLLEHERALALAARPAPGACELVELLQQRGCTLGLLTRNARELALLTLDVLGIRRCFEPSSILGRDEAPPKPRPDGLIQLAQHWHISTTELIMVGDYLNDLQCAHAAGAYSILVNVEGSPWPELTQLQVADCRELHRQLSRSGAFCP